MTRHRTIITLLLFLFVSTFALAQDFEIYVSDAGDFNGDFQIVKFDQNGENPEVFINEHLAWPQDIVFLEDQGVVLISSLNSGRITKHDATTGEFIDDFDTGISGPTRMKIGADSLLYVLQWQGNGRILRYELDGTFVDQFSTTGVVQGIGLDWDAEGDLYVSAYGGSYIRRFDPEGNSLGQFITSGLAGPTNLFFRDNGDLIVFNWNAGTVVSFDSEGTSQGALITGLSNPEGVAFLPNGNMLIGNGGDGSVKEYDMDGNFIGDFIEPGTGGLQTPNAVVIREITPPTAVSEPEVATDLLVPTIGKAFFLKTPAELTSSFHSGI